MAAAATPGVAWAQTPESVGPATATAPSGDAAQAPQTPADTNPSQPVGPDTSQPAAEPPRPPQPTLIVRIDLRKQQMTVQENGRLVRSWRISSGRDGYRTPRGTFRAEWKARMWYSRQYDMAPMPYAVFFKNGSAIHATSETGRLGSPASHGCVRLAPSHAAEFYKMVSRHGLATTRIIVHGNPPDQRIARRDRRGGAEYASRQNNSRGYASASGYSSYGAPRMSPYQPRYYTSW
jgi:lipoprotein-anchoring transpeptidase ErfK/SrfK